jgi:signal transduction histidine kinase
MRHRLEEIGGQCRIQSEPGTGTTIELIVPVSISAAEP